MSSLRSVDLSLIDEILRGGDKGYILDFSDRTFGDFFVRELDIDIDAPEYKDEGVSKAKRLRCFLGKVDDATAARALRALWEHREALRGRDVADPLPRAAGQYAALIARLDGSGPSAPVNVVAAPAIEAIEFDRFRSRLVAIRDLAPQQRGYDFERFLQDLFNAFRLSAREPFRLVGEQIDGSFELAGETYLIEAKWLNRKVGVGDLGAFHAKLDQKAQWARGLFISFHGFTEVGLEGFGRGRRLVGMDGRDIHEALLRGIAIDRLIALKVRHAAETGEVFAPIDKLFP
ncbi:restriction endonuclease [Sphingomonas canadensis]|uniref:Restriction endonuclease n=1 Tax=Sphingomonas canadensis TaxID=1219257 RepID=A0ABW3HBE8_9SPHN|nr:restriction endonuclease [Sphingomonas canadensis]MCW3838156.1 restriction endonuclease [Sphingomonas canadensis]